MRTYTVVTGDSLSEISQRFFGDFSQVDAIARENNITNKDVIYPGQVLKIPDAPAAASGQAAGSETDSNKWLWWLIAAAAAAGAYMAYDRYKKKKKRKSKANEA